MSVKPELGTVVTEKLAALRGLWDELESTTRTKARRLFDANRAELCAQSCAALRGWLSGVHAQLRSDDYGKDLTSVNILLKKQQVGLAGGWGLRGTGDGVQEMGCRVRGVQGTGCRRWGAGDGVHRDRGAGDGVQGMGCIGMGCRGWGAWGQGVHVDGVQEMGCIGTRCRRWGAGDGTQGTRVQKEGAPGTGGARGWGAEDRGAQGWGGWGRV